MEKSRGNAQFSFLFDASSPGGRFYRQVCTSACLAARRVKYRNASGKEGIVLLSEIDRQTEREREREIGIDGDRR